MGGRACVIIINAVVRYEEVPNDHQGRVEMERQLRKCLSNPVIAEAVAENEATAMQVCSILEKAHLMPADLAFLRKALPEYSE
jgi:hypothetical protein